MGQKKNPESLGGKNVFLSHIPHKTKKHFAIIKNPYNIKQTSNGNKEKHQLGDC